LPRKPRSNKIDTLKNDLVYTILQSLIVFKNSDATYDEAEEALEFLKDIDIDKLMHHYVGLLVDTNSKDYKTNRVASIGHLKDLRDKWSKK
jgi:predicted nucleotidyltransferase